MTKLREKILLYIHIYILLSSKDLKTFIWHNTFYCCEKGNLRGLNRINTSICVYNNVYVLFKSHDLDLICPLL